ncbi:MAG: hypothetical protein AABO57_05140 [Acidobacteriota bacterium]
MEVEIWFSNDSQQAFSEVELHIAGPDFLEWRDNSCDGPPLSRPFGTIVTPNSTLNRTLCVRTGPRIKVGNYNILFTLEFKWEANNVGRASYVVSEKPLNVSLFGSDSVAGVPLGLAGFIVPGLFFWLAVSVWKVPWSVGLALGEKLIYSVLVSIGFMVSATLVSYLLVSVGIVRGGGWVNYIDVSTGISVVKLLALAIVGAVLGSFVGGINHFLRQRSEKAKRIEFGDDTQTKLDKLLVLNPDYRQLMKLNPGFLPRTVVRMKSGEQYIGSLSAMTAGTRWLFGWFEIDLVGQPRDVIDKVQKYKKSGNQLAMVRLASGKQMAVKARTVIRKLESGTESPKDECMHWREDEVLESSLEDGKKFGSLLELKS